MRQGPGLAVRDGAGCWDGQGAGLGAAQDTSYGVPPGRTVPQSASILSSGLLEKRKLSITQSFAVKSPDGCRGLGTPGGHGAGRGAEPRQAGRLGAVVSN